MRSRPPSRLRPALTAAAALTALFAAVPAHASDASAPSSGGLFLTVSGDDSTWIRGVLLRCEPEPSGPHPHAAEACAAIDEAGGDLDALPVEQGICTKEYAPVTVSASGVHRGRPISWHKTYANACTMAYSTGDVFRF